MTTVTKFKGVIDNNSLPVLTPEGLLPYWEGKFVNRLSELDYTLSTTQKNATETFLEEIAEEEVVNTVRSFWPFIGSSDNIAAAKVPLIGEKNYDFGDSFTDISYNVNQEIIGLTSVPNIESLNIMDFCDGNQINLGASEIVKPISSVASPVNKGAYPIIFNSNVSQFRTFQYSSEDKFYFGLYCRDTVYGGDLGTFLSSAVPERISGGGNLYVMMGLNNHSTVPYYNRYMKINNDTEKRASGSDTAHTYVAPLPEDEDKTLKTPNESQIAFLTALTGLVVFNRILSDSEMDIFMNAWKKMNIALGKEVSV